jgi:hypothetical protein
MGIKLQMVPLRQDAGVLEVLMPPWSLYATVVGRRRRCL